MGAGLLERVGFTGGNGGGDQPPPLDTTPTPVPGLDPDPAPAEATRSKREARKSATSATTAAKQPRAGGKFVSKDEQTRQVAEELDTMLKLLAFTWSLSDEDCAGVLNDTSSRIAADMSSLICRSEWLRDKVAGSGIFLDIIKFLTGASPLIKAVVKHHITGRAEVVSDDPTIPVAVVDPNQYGPWRPQFS